MNNSHDEIKKLLNASRKMLSTKESIQESFEIKKQYNLIFEEKGDDVFKKINVAKSIEKNTTETYDDDTMINNKRDKSVSYRISGGLLKIIGKTNKELQLTEDEKKAFQETMDEFVDEVSNLVDFNELIILQNDVTWSGTLNDFGIEFDYRVGEENGVYIKMDNLSKLSFEIMEIMEKLKKYYNKFKSKWGDIIGDRKVTKID